MPLMWVLVDYLAKKDIYLVFFSEKFNGTRKNYSTYDIEFYVIIQAL